MEFPAFDCELLLELLTFKWIVTNFVVWLLHVLLLREKVEKLQVCASLVVQQIFVFAIGFIFPPDSPANVIFLWISVFVYEQLLGDKFELRDNFSFASDLPSQYYQDTELIESSTDSGTLRTDLKCLVVVKRGQSVIKGSLPLDLIYSVNSDVIDDKLVNSLHKLGFDVKCCFQVTTEDEKKRSLDFVLVASCQELKERWVASLKSWVGIADEDVHKIWLKKLLCLSEDEVGEKEFDISDALTVVNKAGRCINAMYLLYLFEYVGQANQKSTLLRNSIGSIKNKFWKEDKIESKVHLKLDKFAEFFKTAVTPSAVDEIFKRIRGKRKKADSMSARTFKYFLQEIQRDLEESENHLEQISLIEPVFEYSNVSIIGITRYLLDEDHSVFNTRMQDSMDHPLSHYYIASSHNTYLTKDQLKSKSSVDMYVRALERGCKCLELDCWDGSDNEPVIYHGYTLTSKILFKDVISAIQKYAFCRSPYPVILSFEIHCSIEQQKVMARHLRDILGDMLYLKPIPVEESSLPSPEDLKGFVIVKAKKIAEGLDEMVVEDPEGDMSDEEVELTEVDILKELGEQKDFDMSDIVSVGSQSDDEEASNREKKTNKLQALLEEVPLNQRKKNKKQVLKVAKEMSDLVVYCQSKRFRGFDRNSVEDGHVDICSLQEKKAVKLAREASTKFMGHTREHLLRVYPSGYRIDSSNYNPVQFWNVGCQLVALNYQTASKEMQLNQGLFQLNGGCGYVLKPKFLREEADPSKPHIVPDSYKTISIRIIGGHQLPSKFSNSVKSERNYIVHMRVFGVEADNQTQQTSPAKSNGINPIWDEVFLFKIHIPQLALLKFTVCSKTVTAQYCLPIRSLERGYRRVPLLNKHSELIKESFLLVQVEYI